MEEVHYKSASLWYAAKRARRGHELVAINDPCRRLIGFLDHTEDKQHLIGLASLHRGLWELPVEVIEALNTPEGRQKMLED